MGLMDTVSSIIGRYARESLIDFVRTETLDGDTSLVMKDGTLMSMLALDGALDMMGKDDLEQIVTRLRIALSPYMINPGHAIEVTFTRDPAAAKLTLEKIVTKTKRSATHLGLDVSDVLNERLIRMPNSLVGENCVICVYTRPEVLTRDEARMDARTVAEQLVGTPPMKNSQMPGRALDGVYARHVSLSEALVRDLANCSQAVRLLSVEDALREIRASLYPSTAPYKDQWTPRMPHKIHEVPGREVKKSRIKMMPDAPAEIEAIDFSNLGVPTFDTQLSTEDCEILDSRTVQIGDSIFSAFDMTVAPEVLLPFDDLVRSVTAAPEKVSWRASFLIESGGVQAFALKEQYVKIMAFAAPTRNRRIRDTLQMLRDIDGQSDTVVRLRVSFSAWVTDGDRMLLRRTASILRRSVERWGSCITDGISGDPMATVLSSVAGIAPESTAPVAGAPLTEALAMLPLSRLASPWQDGSVLMRTEDGKLWPYQPGSSQQTTWVDVFCGTPGSGKSVTMNALNFASALASNVGAVGTPELPRIAIIDIGYSSAGLISLLQEALPPDRRHEVVHKRLKMTSAYAINPFDTQLGMRSPLASERQFLINFLAVLFSDGDKNASPAMSGLIAATIDESYKMLGDDRNPKRYLKNDEPEVQKALESFGFKVTNQTSWWMVVDVLKKRGFLHEAEIAQRHAVPDLSTLVAASQVEQISTLYESAVDDHSKQTIMKSFQRTISEIQRDYPILASHTRFDVGSARIVALDLDEVTAKTGSDSSKRQTALMYMLARHALARDFFLDEDEIRANVRAGVLPPFYEDMHVQRARSNKQMPKRICMDEFHRTGGLKGIRDQVTTDIREGRKHNIQIALASQLLDDFDDAVIEMATSIWICNAPSESAIKKAKTAFGLNEVAEEVLRYELTGPTSRGAPIYCIFKNKGGTIKQKLFITLGPAELWALSTTSEDAALRRHLYEAVGPRAARLALANRFPGGSAKAEIETRIAKIEEEGTRLDDKARGSLIEQVSQEIQRQMFPEFRAAVAKL